VLRALLFEPSHPEAEVGVVVELLSCVVANAQSIEISGKRLESDRWAEHRPPPRPRLTIHSLPLRLGVGVCGLLLRLRGEVLGAFIPRYGLVDQGLDVERSLDQICFSRVVAQFSSATT
jgi:hypothetical protein